MFYQHDMQRAFDFADDDVAHWAANLAGRFGEVADAPRRKPVGQLVKSMLGARTRDAVSLAAYRRLGYRWPRASDLAVARPGEVEREIRDVTFAEVKAVQLVAALRMIGRTHPDFRLDFLGRWPVAEALAWLERLPGVGRKVAASTLNASTLRRPVFIVDSHVLRVLRRLGFVAPSATAVVASEAMTASGLDAGALYRLFAHMKHLGQTICRFDAPDCTACPLAARCRAASIPGFRPAAIAPIALSSPGERRSALEKAHV